jgi:hypothetical protein
MMPALPNMLQNRLRLAGNVVSIRLTALRAIHFLIDYPVVGGNHENPFDSTHPWSLLIFRGARLQQARGSAGFQRLTVL